MSTSQELNLHSVRATQGNREDDIHFSEILSYLLAAKWTILSIVGVVFIIATVKAYTAVPIYHAEVMLHLEESQRGVPGIDVGAQPFSAGGSQAELDIIKSRRIVGEAVDVLGLANHITPRYFPFIGATLAQRHKGKELAVPLFGLDEYPWGGEVLKLDPFEVSGKLENTASTWLLITGEDQGYTVMDGERQVLAGKVGETVSASHDGSTIKMRVSELAARPGVAFTINRASRSAAIDSLRGRLGVRQSGDRFRKSGMVFISISGPDPQTNVDIVNAVAAAYVDNNRQEQAKEADTQLNFINGQLPALKARQDHAALELQKFQREVGLVNITTEIENTLEQLEELKDEATALQLQKEELQQNYTEEHPLLKSLARKIEVTEENKRELEQSLRDLPEKEWIYLQKSREVEASTELYRNMLNTAQELEIAKAGMIGRVRIVDPAVLQPWNVKTGRTRILLIGLSLY